MMTGYLDLSIVAVFALVYSVIAGRVERLPLSGPIVFTIFGLVCGPLGLGILNLDITAESLRTLAELTLAVMLFTDAAGVGLQAFERNWMIPGRLLLIGLPATILLGIAAGRLALPGLPLLEITVLAVMLAPTDAALGSSVVSNPKVPFEIREGLEVESGLNDGLCVPVLFLVLAMAAGEASGIGSVGLAVRLAVEQIGIGIAVGLVTAALGWRGIAIAVERGRMARTWQQVPVVALALSCFAVAQVLGGSGFIAAFCGGLLFGGAARRKTDEYLVTSTAVGNILALVTWVVFGAAVVSRTIDAFSWPVLAYAVLSLTVVRMVPVLVSLVGSGISFEGKLFMGWFGPRGLASIVFAVIVVDRQVFGAETLGAVVACTVLLSILAHGVSATPMTGWLASRTEQTGRSQAKGEGAVR
jgi:NhaP-type Na+/H+ or K+/H+ antiporter